MGTDMRERVKSLAFGAPLGSRPLTRRETEPYGVYAAKRDRRFSRFFTASAVAVILALVLGALPAMAASPGYWVRSNFTGSGAIGTPFTATWTWYAKDGSVPSRISVNGVETDNPMQVEGVAATTKPATPSGWYACYSASMTPAELEENRKTELPDPDTPEGQNSMWNKTIRDNPPEFGLDKVPEFVSNSFTALMHSAFRGIVSICSDVADWLLSIVGVHGTALVDKDFSTGTFARFYQVADKVSAYAFEPYALALLAIVFVTGLIHVSDPRRRLQGTDWLEEVLMLVAMMAVSVTLILHAMDLCGGAYWLARNLVKGVSDALVAIGMTPGDLGNSTVSTAILGHYDSLTYAQGGAVLVYVLISAIAMVVSATTAFHVLSVLLLRAGEIYLRASASPLCLALLVDEKTRSVGMGYIRRFFAVCFQAAIIFIALALSPLFFAVAGDIIGTVGASDIPGVADILQIVIPTVCALMCVSGIVKSSESIANSIFGLA